MRVNGHSHRNTDPLESRRRLIRDSSIIGGLLLVVTITYSAIHMTGQSSQAELGGQVSAPLIQQVERLDDVVQLVGTGNQLMDSGRYDEAILHYSRALLLDSTLVDVRVDRGASYFALNRHQEAISDFIAAVNSRPDHVTAHFNLGIAYSALDNDSLAISYWERCLELQPDGDITDRVRQLLEQHGR